jgi:hypothetical protein
MNLGIDGGSNANGAAAIQASPTGAVNQDWLKRSTGYPAGVVALVNRKSGLCLGISGGSLNDGAQAAQFFCDGSPTWAGRSSTGCDRSGGAYASSAPTSSTRGLA